MNSLVGSINRRKQLGISRPKKKAAKKETAKKKG